MSNVVKVNTYDMQNKLQKILRTVNRKVDTLQENVTDSLSMDLTDHAKQNFRNAEYDGFNDVIVYRDYERDVEAEKRRVLHAHVVAEGKSVAFIEFGTGVTYTPRSHPWSGKVRFSIVGGSYGKGYGARPNGWYYKGYRGSHGSFKRTTRWGNKQGWIHTYGNPSNRCLYNATLETRQNVRNIVRQEVGKL